MPKKLSKKVFIQEKLAILAAEYGFADPVYMCANAITDNICPSICMNPDCDYTTDMEPDQREGWCEVCDTNTVVSAMVLLGVI